jgi:hypothetical protein
LKGTKKCAKSRQLHYEDCLREIRVEPGSNGDNEYVSGLLEKILHRDNMNLAYKRGEEQQRKSRSGWNDSK